MLGTRKQLVSIQVLRALAALMVVSFHLMTEERKVRGTGGWLSGHFAIGNAGVDLFFVISGFIMVSVCREHFGSWRAIPRFLYRRVLRIYPLYWLVTLAIFGLLALRSMSTSRTELEIAQALLLLPGYRLPILPVAWTLIHEMWFYLVFALLMTRPYRELPWWLGLWGAAVVAAQLWLSAGTLFPPVPRLISHPLSLEFIAGAYLGIYFSRTPWPDTRMKNSLRLLCSMSGPLLFAALWLLFRSQYPGILPGGWPRVAVFGVPALVTVTAFVLLERGGVRMPPLLARIGDESYALYLSHSVFLSVFGLGWARLVPRGELGHAIALVTAASGCLALAALLHRGFELPLLERGRRFFPEP